MSTPTGSPPGDEHPVKPFAPSPYSSYPPGSRKQTASIMWALATMVVALVGGFLIYTAITQDDSSTTADQGSADQGSADQFGASAGATDPGGTDPVETDSGATDPGAVTDAQSGTDAGEESTAAESDESAEAPAEEQTGKELTEEQKEYILGLQRRDADDPMAMGAVDAPVVLIEYADYRCPYCAQWSREVQPELQDLIDDGTLRIEFRDRILFGEDSEAVALAARAAGEQGLFWEFHDAVFAVAPEGGHPDFPREKLLGFAEEIGVPDLAKFEKDLDSDTLRELIELDQAEATSLGVNSTPTFLVNTSPIVGGRPAEVFRAIIAHELATVEE